MILCTAVLSKHNKDAPHPLLMLHSLLPSCNDTPDEKYMLFYFPHPLEGNGPIMGLHYMDLLWQTYWFSPKVFHITM